VHLVERGHKSHLDAAEFRSTWGVAQQAEDHAPSHDVVLLQRSTGKMGAGPGKTTGWVHRLVLLRANVEMIADVSYRQIDDEGLHISVGSEDRLIKCDSIVLCAGQLSVNALADELQDGDRPVHVIGGASFAGELDAQRAIEEGTLLGSRL
jgi:2,4-dienoyl-CoA reductase (NADPH2)